MKKLYTELEAILFLTKNPHTVFKNGEYTLYCNAIKNIVCRDEKGIVNFSINTSKYENWEIVESKKSFEFTPEEVEAVVTAVQNNIELVEYRKEMNCLKSGFTFNYCAVDAQNEIDNKKLKLLNKIMEVLTNE